MPDLEDLVSASIDQKGWEVKYGPKREEAMLSFLSQRIGEAGEVLTALMGIMVLEHHVNNDFGFITTEMSQGECVKKIALWQNELQEKWNKILSRIIMAGETHDKDNAIADGQQLH